MLDPALCCDSYHRTKGAAVVSDCFSDLPSPFSSAISFVLSGACSAYHLDSPPCPSLCFPFIGGAPLAAAKRQTAFLEAACDILGAAVQQASASRVKLYADRRALVALEPATMRGTGTDL